MRTEIELDEFDDTLTLVSTAQCLVGGIWVWACGSMACLACAGHRGSCWACLAIVFMNIFFPLTLFMPSLPMSS